MPIGAKRGALVPPDPGRAALDQMRGLWAYPEIRVVKSADGTAVNNSTTLINDDELLFAGAANEVWSVEMCVLYTASVGADFMIGWFYPTGAVISGMLWARDTIGNPKVHQQFVESQILDVGGYGVSSIAGLSIRAVVTMGATPGNVGFRYAQVIAEVSDAKTRQYSWLKAQRLT